MSNSVRSGLVHDGRQFAAAHLGPEYVRFGKLGEIFWILDKEGLVEPENKYGCGLYRNDTRHLSTWTWRINGLAPAYLSASEEGGWSTSRLYANPECRVQDQVLPRQSLLMRGELVAHDGILHERMLVENFHHTSLKIDLELLLAHDAADMFHVRSSAYHPRGRIVLPRVVESAGGAQLVFAYLGKDGNWVQTVVDFPTIKPSAIKISRSRPVDREGVPSAKVTFSLSLERRPAHDTEVATNDHQAVIELRILAMLPSQHRINGRNRGSKAASLIDSSETFSEAQSRAQADFHAWSQNNVSVRTGNEQLNRALERATRDLYCLMLPTDFGHTVAAGMPWYVAPFGRDSSQAGKQTCKFMPQIARGVLATNFGYQATEHDEERAMHPGKIMHELHIGELARLKAIQHTPVYTSADSTPLTLILFAEYGLTSGDVDFVDRYWANAEAGLSYIDWEIERTRQALGKAYLGFGLDGKFMSIHSWMDSFDSHVRSDGSLAVLPIASCEVQSYVFEAWQKMASLAELRGKTELANQLRFKATKLKTRFQRDFWMPSKNYLAQALDAVGQVDGIASNAGHCLGSGILSAEQCAAVAAMLVSRDGNGDGMLSRWGIRTRSSREKAYNPMGYHAGTVWPHDNAEAAAGLFASGHHSEGHLVFMALMNLLGQMTENRMPELVCGFDRLVPYPAACKWQAWVAGLLCQLLQAMLGLEVNALGGENKLVIATPSVPDWIGFVELMRLPVGSASVDLRFTAESNSGSRFTVLSTTGDLKIVSPGGDDGDQKAA